MRKHWSLSWTVELMLLALLSVSGVTSALSQNIGKRVPVKAAVEWLEAPESKIVYDTVIADLAKLGIEHVPFNDYWNFCLHLSSAAVTDPSSGVKWYAIKIEVFNRLKFFSAYHGIPFSDQESFVHRFKVVNEPESITIVSESELQSEIADTLDRFNRDVFSTVKSYH